MSRGGSDPRLTRKTSSSPTWCSSARPMGRRRRLPLVPALEKGASKGAVEDHVHQPGGRRSPVNLDLLGLVGEVREDVAVLSGAGLRRGSNVATRSGVVWERRGLRREV